jgi:glycosyltransferase involved in cell wall biosynthesis
MPAARQTICLSMIVRDETDILPRLFESCRGLIDYWVICDTGSTDGTQDVIQRELGGIPGELHQREWVNFGVNRTEVVELSHQKSDYLLLLDADMTLRTEQPLGALTAGAYLLLQSSGVFEYRTKRLVRGDLRWRYVGSTHEFIETSDGTETVEPLDALVVDHHADGHSWENKFERDIDLLTRDLLHDPANGRAQFYLAQSCRDLATRTGNRHMLTNAADHYQRRAEMPGWDEETYFAQYQVGVLAARMGQWPRAIEAYIGAWESRPERLEAVHALTVGLRERGCYRTAHRFARMAANLKPLQIPDDILFVAPWVYQWGILFEYSITSYWVGDFRSSFAACKKLLTIETLSEECRALTISNAQHAVRECTRAAAQPPARERKLTHTGTPTRGRAAR